MNPGAILLFLHIVPCGSIGLAQILAEGSARFSNDLIRYENGTLQEHVLFGNCTVLYNTV